MYPLILVELDTLIAFKNYFQSDSVRFKKILDKYYDYITTNKKNKSIEQISREYFPFYTFMAKEIVKSPFENTIFKEVYNSLIKALNIEE